MGISSLITAIFFCDFLLVKNSYSVILADIEENATGLLDRVKLYIKCYEHKMKVKVPLKYNSRFELYNPLYNTTFKIGTSQNYDFGRSKTITNLHLSELAFYKNISKIMAGCVQAVTDDGKVIIETTANGFNEYKKMREDNKRNNNGYRQFFFKASDFYSETFLNKKRAELGIMYSQEYPENETEAFLTSGDCYFDKEALKVYITRTREPLYCY